MKLFVIAGNLAQFHEFRRNKLETSYWHQTMFPNANDWVYVSSVNSLRGCTIEHGTFIGTWKQIPNLEGIFRELMIHCKIGSHTADNLHKIHADWHAELAQDILNMNVNVPKPQAPAYPIPIELKQESP